MRVVDIDGAPGFVATDVSRVLGFDMRRGAYAVIRPLGADERAVLSRKHTPWQIRGVEVEERLSPQQPSALFPRGSQMVTVISESGLYKLVMRSDKPEAKAFQDWMAREVLPSIRPLQRPASARTAPLPQASLVGGRKGVRRTKAPPRPQTGHARTHCPITQGGGDLNMYGAHSAPLPHLLGWR